jgi:hypothetical protein
MPNYREMFNRIYTHLYSQPSDFEELPVLSTHLLLTVTDPRRTRYWVLVTLLMPYVEQYSSCAGVFEVNLSSNVSPVLPSRIHSAFCDLTLGGLCASRIAARP